MYHYVGKVRVGPLSGYLWLLGSRLYLRLGWRPSDTYFLGNLSDPLTLAAKLKRLIPRPVDVRRATVALARALAASRHLLPWQPHGPPLPSRQAQAAYSPSSGRQKSRRRLGQGIGGCAVRG